MFRSTGPATSQGVEAGAFWGPDKHSQWPEWQTHHRRASEIRRRATYRTVWHSRLPASSEKAAEHCDCVPANPLDMPAIDPRFSVGRERFRQHAKRAL